MDQLLWPSEASDALGSSTVAQRIRRKHERAHLHATQANNSLYNVAQRRLKTQIGHSCRKA